MEIPENLACREETMLLIGTAGYSYDDWVGPIYPADIDKKEMLVHYAREFPFTEVNSSYYRMPNKFMVYHMARKTPENFSFVIKAHQSMTHSREMAGKAFDEFRDALQPLIDQGKLGCILAQFPQSFHNTVTNRAYLKYFREKSGSLPVVVEFRHRSWLEEEVFGLLHDEGMGFVAVDEPPLKNLMPPECRATSTVGYVRFHGRNSAKWWDHEHSYERYDYLYTEDELAEWIPRIKELLERTEKTYISFNNHFLGKSVLNARALGRILKETGIW